MSKVILITGASSGLGEYLADYLAGQGYIVYGSSRSIKQETHKFNTVVMDVCNTESVKAGILEIISKEGKIDIVINNAGLGLASPFEHTAMADIDRLFDTNVKGVIRVSQEVLPFMRKQGSGKIIQVSSIASEFGLPYRGMYCASKAAVERYTEALRIEVKKYGIQACLLQPGGIQTDINKNRMISPMPDNSPYKESFRRCYEIVNASVSKGYPLEPFGPIVKGIIDSKHIKQRYRVSKFTEKLSVLLKRIMPSSLFERILLKHYKI